MATRKTAKKTRAKRAKKADRKPRGPADHLTPAQVDYYRARVGELYLANNSIRAISDILSAEPLPKLDGEDEVADGLAVSRDLVHRLLLDLRREWQDRAFESISKQKARELAKLDRLEEEAWRAWERSVGLHVKTKSKGVNVGPEGGEPEDSVVVEMETERTEEMLAGDPRFLAQIERCIAKRVEILGIIKRAESDSEAESFEKLYDRISKQLKGPGDVDALLNLVRAIPDPVAN